MKFPQCCLVLLFTPIAFAAENLYPEPGFEESGVAGTAHSGERAGYLSVDARQHWVNIGGRFGVEPYATYRATAFAKATVKEGAVKALYVYQWDSYVWAFTSEADVPDGQDWQQVSTTFCVPHDHVWLHPLAFFGAANTEAWIDDITVEQIASPEETIAALEAKPALSDNEARLAARWFAEHGELAKAETLMQQSQNASVRADIACVIGKAAEDPGLRKRMLLEMIRYGAPGLHAGMQRLDEVAAALEGASPIDIVFEALPEYADDEAMLANAAAYVAHHRDSLQGGVPATVAARRADLGRIKQAIARVAEKLGDRAAASPGLGKLEAMTHEMKQHLEQQAAALGTCTVILAGRPLAPDTHAIVLAAEPTPQEMTAARDLQMHLELMTGKEFPIIDDSATDGRVCLSVGKNAFTASMELGVDYAALGADGIRIATKGPHLALTGNKRGVLYAVYVFLEEHLGCRWFTPDCMTWPTAGTLEVGALDRAYVPPFEYRDTDYPNCRPPVFGVRNRLNGKYSLATEEWGGKIDYQGFVHTFNGLVPPEEHFATHPEYFSEIDGQRVGERSQLCLTNPDVLRVATETVYRWIAENPAASIISVSQNDWHNYCQCANCSALAEKEGSQSGPLLHFVNGIAAAVAEKHPDIIIDTLAYQYTRKPPAHVKPLPNVAVRLCSIECEFNRPLAESPFNKTFVSDIKDWGRICDRLHIWDYVINYHHCVQPFPNFQVLQPNIQFFRDHGVTGIYEEANYFSKGGEFAELRTYLLAKLLWDAACDVDKAIEEFCEAYYGKCWQVIRAYIDDVHRLAVSDPNFHMTIWAPPHGPFQSAEALSRYTKLFDAAEIMVADDPVRLHRVEVARLPILYTQLAQASNPAFAIGEEALVPVTPGGSVAELASRFERIAKEEGLTRISENATSGNLDTWLSNVRNGAQTYPLVRLQNASTEVLVVPGLGGRILSLKHNGQECMNVVHVAGGIDPKTGGYKEFSESEYRSPGWLEPFELLEHGERHVMLRGVFANGFSIERRYELAEDGPILRIASKLTNESGETRSTQLRVHPCFHLENAVGAELQVAGGGSVALDSGAQSEREHSLSNEALPRGEWRVVDPAANRIVISRFEPAQVAVCYFNWNGPEKRANLELWSPTTPLQAGESITLAHEYEVQAFN